MKEYIDDVKAGGIVLGDTLETALELGEKHEAFVSKCKTVSHIPHPSKKLSICEHDFVYMYMYYLISVLHATDNGWSHGKDP